MRLVYDAKDVQDWFGYGRLNVCLSVPRVLLDSIYTMDEPQYRNIFAQKLKNFESATANRGVHPPYSYDLPFFFSTYLFSCLSPL